MSTNTNTNTTTTNDNLDENSKKILAIRKLLKDRDIEKQNANFAKADSMREYLKEKYGVIVIDQKNGNNYYNIILNTN